MTRKPTIKDVASLAGVGPMTVSRLLNQSAHVSEEAAARIYRAIEELGYKPNEMARALRGQKSCAIGIIVPYLYDPFFAMCAQGVSTVARENGYSVILTTSDEDFENENAEAQSMLRRNVDGLIIIPAEQKSAHLTTPEFHSTHIVALDRPLPDLRFSSVVVENRAGVERAVTHLISAHGHRRIAAAARDIGIYTSSVRIEGYTWAMRQAGLEPLPALPCPTLEQTAVNVREMLRGPNAPTAIFTANGLTTQYVFKALHDLGIRIPQDLALVAFDDFEMAELLEPQLSVIRQPAVELGETAGRLLFERMAEGQPSDQGIRLVLPVEWIPRHSCGCHLSVVSEFVPQVHRQAV
jgi:LacI family transcriptional regulator, galactose operon repressor